MDRSSIAQEAKRSLGNLVGALRSEIPRRFRDKGFDQFQRGPGNAAAFDAAKRFADEFSGGNGQCIIFTGDVGLGKTHLGCAILMAVVEKGASGLYKTASSLVADVQSGYSDGTSRSKINRLQSVDLLVIDEVGRHKSTPDATSILFEVIDGRYQSQKSTIVLTNLPLSGELTLESSIGPATLDRLREGGAAYAFKGKSRRGQNV